MRFLSELERGKETAELGGFFSGLFYTMIRVSPLIALSANTVRMIVLADNEYTKAIIR